MGRSPSPLSWPGEGGGERLELPPHSPPPPCLPPEAMLIGRARGHTVAPTLPSTCCGVPRLHRDPATGLPVVQPEDADTTCSGGSPGTAAAFGSSLRLGDAAVLHLGWVNRYTEKGKPLRRMLAVTRAAVLVAYADDHTKVQSVSRHLDAAPCRCIPLSSISCIQVFAGEDPPKLAIRADAPEFDLLLSFTGDEHLDTVLCILQRCGDYPTVFEPSGKRWVEAVPKLKLKKPRDWKLRLFDGFLPALEDDPLCCLPDDLRSLFVASGIPKERRADVWFTVSGAARAAETQLYGDYDLLAACPPPLPPDARVQIERDVPRTFPTGGVPSLCRETLEAVLVAHTASGPDGYCQGHNYLAGVLVGLYAGDPLKAYYMLGRITREAHYSKGYYDEDLVGVGCDAAALQDMVAEQLPQVSRKLLALGTSVADHVVPWLLCLFTVSVPYEGLLELWDGFVVCGTSFLFSFVVAFLESNSCRILKAEDVASAAAVFESLQDVPLRPLISAALTTHRVPRSRLMFLRKAAVARLQQQHQREVLSSC